uniref:Si:ch211-166a6.5 n=1 Tax=Cynoglossus semilaevis TaxID=244447 RepID=A0A3P8W2U0_CYNSE
MNLLSKNEVFPRSSLSLSFAGSILDPLAELQNFKGLKQGAVIRLVPSYLKDLCLSCWNPPPGHRKLQGDFLYISVVTTEGRRCEITSCPKGFFLNRSTEDVFDPRPVQSSTAFHCLTDLLCLISPAFKKTLSALKNRSQLPTVEVMPTPYHTMTWLGPSCATHKNTFSRLGVDEQTARQTPDWNEELQAARDLPQGNLEERLLRDRALLEVNSGFVRTVMQAAEAVIDGFVEPVNGNPDEPAFLWGGLFMSQGAANATFGGERGRRAAQRLELKTVQVYSDSEGLQGLHTLPTAIVDYRGVRLSAQGLAPGLEGSEGLLYGINAGPQESPCRRQLLGLLAQAAKSLCIQKNVVVAPNGHSVPLFTSVDAQGLVGADRRLYILDVFRSFPADANFCPEGYHTDVGSTEALRVACKEVGSVSDIIFEMRFNPNVFCPVNLQKRLQREAAAFIITHQIPGFVKQCLQNYEAPMDGVSLKHALHQQGINLRYLGHMMKAICQSEHKQCLRHILVRFVSAKINSNAALSLQGVDVPSLCAAVSHFLCCLLVPHFAPTPAGEEAKKKSRRRGRGAGPSESTAWSTLTGPELWNLVCQDAVETYNISDSLGSGPNQFVEQYGLQKLSLLREFCLKTGVQVTSDGNPLFFSDEGLLDQAHEQLKEAAYLFGRVCDDLHPDAGYCNSLLARVAYLQGKTTEARSIQQKAVIISERVLSFDHPNTIQQYTHLGVYMFAGGETALAQKCLLRARLLMLTVHGEDHPYTATLDNCLGLILTGDQRGQYLKNALRLNTSFFGPFDLHTALSSHLLAQWLCSKGDYRGAMTHEKEALTAFTYLVSSDRKAQLTFLWLLYLTSIHIISSSLETTINKQLESLAPTIETILEQMVLVTGIRNIKRYILFYIGKLQIVMHKKKYIKQQTFVLEFRYYH